MTGNASTRSVGMSAANEPKSRTPMGGASVSEVPFVCRHADPRCDEDPCPWGIARVLCNAPADHPIRARQASNPTAEVV